MPVENSPCHGNGDNHCCYLPGGSNVEFGEGVCPFLVQNVVPGRRFACGLLVELRRWEAVHADERYLATVAPKWRERGIADCGDWGPGTNQCCFSR